MKTPVNLSSLERFQVAIPTVFESNEELSVERTVHIASHLIKQGVKSLLVCGTTGEQHSLNLQEKLSLLEGFDTFQKEHKDIQIFFGIASVRQKEAEILADKLSITSLIGGLLGFPPYLRPTQKEAIGYAQSVIERAQKPIILYNNPLRTGFTLEIASVLKLIDSPLVCGLKEAGDPVSIQEYQKLIDKEGFLYFAGGEVGLWEKLKIGFNALSSMGGNIFPVLTQKVFYNYLSGDLEEAEKNWEALWKLLAPMYQGSVLSNLKTLFREQGIDAGFPRLPLGGG